MNMSSGAPGFFGLWVVIVWGATALVHIAFAWSILVDADLMWRTERRKPIFAGAGLWGLATLLGGPLVAGVYWVMHHSTLRTPVPPASAPPRPRTTPHP